MQIFIIILHFGSTDVTKNCVQSLFLHETYPFSLVVINNAKDHLDRKDFSDKKTTVINNRKNLGFAAGVNVGIRYALKEKADVVCLLNNDTSIRKPFLGKLMQAFERKNVGIAGPAIHFLKNEKQLYDIGGEINSLFLRTSHTEVSKITNRNIRIVPYISGCCMGIKKEVFTKIGYFDESFFLYFEDADFCLRAKAKGFVTAIVPSVVIDHALSKSAGKMSSLAIYYLLKSGILFGKKYAKASWQIICNRVFILFQVLLFFKANPKAVLSIIKALSAI